MASSETQGTTGPRKSPAQVAHLVPEYLPRSATFIYTLLRHQRRYRPIVLARTTSHIDEFPIHPIYELEPPLKAAERLPRRLRAAGWGYRSCYEREMVEHARRHRCVLAHAHFGWSGRDGLRATNRLGIPLVTTFYGRDLSETARARRRDPYRRLFAEGDLFICEGPAMADQLIAAGAPAARVRIAPIGIELSRFPFSQRPRGRPLVIIQCARFVEKKGVELTVRAFAAARPAIGPAELVLVGDGPLRSEIETAVSCLGLKSCVHLPGLVSHREYRRLAERANICMQPSRTAADGDTEGGAPVVVLEMQALGIPVIATTHADIPFVVPRPSELVPEDDVSCLAEALVRVATESDDEQRTRAHEARKFVERRHDANVTAAAVESLYDEVLG